MKVVGIIPARYQSSRFPGKPLALIHGKSMIERVYNRVIKSSKLNEIVVATDDQRIYDHVMSFGGKAVLTSSTHQSGTDRCEEALQKMKERFDVVINIQGDEPYIHPEQVDLIIGCFEDPVVEIATLVRKISIVGDLENTNIPKVVMKENGNALYFSRNAIPYCKPENKLQFINDGFFFKHIGIYGYRADILQKLAALSVGELEMSESLEQLRWLAKDFNIKTTISDHENMAVDTPEDIALIEAHYTLSD